MNNYDLIVIGGGINGAAIAREASLRGLQTILFEKKDFACGASSKSSKLVHGGLRYLEQFNFRLVRESLKERSVLLKTLPHQVKLLPFIYPVYEKHRHPLWMVRLGLHIYDFLSPGDFPKHSHLSSSNILSLFPELEPSELVGGCLYYDAQMLDNRIVMSNLNSAKALGCTTLNYTPVTNLYYENDKAAGVYYRTADAKPKLCKGKTIVNATGAWSDAILKMDSSSGQNQVKPTKGVHLVLPQIHPTHALLLRAPQDGRVFFLLPWEGFSLLGTTDTPYHDNPDEPKVLDEDIEYLLTAFHHYFPKSNVDRSSILSSFAGLRPLVRDDNKASSSISRSSSIFRASSGLITLLGGKYTTYRSTATEVVDLVVKDLNLPAQKSSGTDCIPFIDKHLLDKQSDNLVHHLITHYGENYKLILANIQKHPNEGTQICPFHPHVYAEIRYVIENEQAQTLEDWFERRTHIAYLPCKGIHCAESVAKKFAEILSWDVSYTNLQICEFKKNRYKTNQSPNSSLLCP